MSKVTTLIALATLCFVSLRFLQDDPFPYGKGKEIANKTTLLSRATEFLPISAKSAWRYSFMPTIIIPILVLLFTPARYIFYPKNAIAFGITFFHCFYPTILYSSKISRHAHPIGILVFLAIFVVNVVHKFYVFHGIANVLTPESFTLPVCCGAVISAFGVAVNHYHDAILTALRDEGKGYQIPMGGLFTWISCPNYYNPLLVAP
ncbi:Steroid 5-alpha-reductase DET2 [Folsomia candida]|uniref:Steroid 5-alpha-reductase DET2 n=2 Tax=Folsomia candida TaxID=158441 RepID=A0A226DW21_FOLCA|nr:Steroid 5-alpha-reductase DET2 [Folsomia candida]